MGAKNAIVAEGLQKRFGETHALRGLDLSAEEGTVLGVLGPNGAGKSTAVRILTTLLKPDGGHAEVAGLDVVRQANELRSRIGLTGQNAAVDELLTGRENLQMFGRLYHLPGKFVKGRADEAAGTLRAHRRRQPHRQDVFGRHATAAGPRGEPDRGAAGALPG